MVGTGALMDIETRRFATPLERYRFPLAPGETWNQWVDNFNETHASREGKINRYARVGGWEKVVDARRHVRRDPAARADAPRRRGVLALSDDVQLPDLVRAGRRRAGARGKGSRVLREAATRGDGQGAIRAQHTLLELVSFTPGRS